MGQVSVGLTVGLFGFERLHEALRLGIRVEALTLAAVTAW